VKNIFLLVVDERYRKQGIGQALMEHAEVWALERGAAGMELTVYGFYQQARSMYRALGYGVLNHRMSKHLDG